MHRHRRHLRQSRIQGGASASSALTRLQANEKLHFMEEADESGVRDVFVSNGSAD